MKQRSTAKHEAFPESWLKHEESHGMSDVLPVTFDRSQFPVQVLESLAGSDCDRWVDAFFAHADSTRNAIVQAIETELSPLVLSTSGFQSIVTKHSLNIDGHVRLETRLQVLVILRRIQADIRHLVDHRKLPAKREDCQESQIIDTAVRLRIEK